VEESIIEKRAFERISTHIWTGIMHSSGNIICSGITKNCSEKSMYISSALLFLFDSKAEILIPMEKEILRIPTKVTRIVMRGNVYNGIVVDILNPSQNYLEFVASQKNVRHSPLNNNLHKERI
jgi:hypothetical protein